MCILHRLFKFPRIRKESLEEFLERSEDRKDFSPLIGHRGGGHEAPENTLAAFRQAKKNGAKGVEFDLDFTKDGEAIVFHDSTVERTTDGHGEVNTFTLEEIRKLDASAKHPKR